MVTCYHVRFNKFKMSQKPHQNPLSEQAEKLFQALQALGSGWHTRAAIAGKISRKRLNIYDVALLQILSEANRIEISQQAAPGPIGYQWLYRVKEESSDK